MVLTVSNAIAMQMGWQVGNMINIEKNGDNVVLRSAKRQPRGRKSLAELLEGIDVDEIQELNASVADFMNSPSQGKEV